MLTGSVKADHQDPTVFLHVEKLGEYFAEDAHVGCLLVDVPKQSRAAVLALSAECDDVWLTR